MDFHQSGAFHTLISEFYKSYGVKNDHIWLNSFVLNIYADMNQTNASFQTVETTDGKQSICSNQWNQNEKRASLTRRGSERSAEGAPPPQQLVSLNEFCEAMNPFSLDEAERYFSGHAIQSMCLLDVIDFRSDPDYFKMIDASMGLYEYQNGKLVRFEKTRPFSGRWLNFNVFFDEESNTVQTGSILLIPLTD